MYRIITHARFKDESWTTFCGCDPYFVEADWIRENVNCYRCMRTKLFRETFDPYWHSRPLVQEKTAPKGG